jgi:hypothetical protein
MILDDEDILISNSIKDTQNPFLGLINYTNVDDLMIYEDEILNIVKNIKLPNFHYDWEWEVNRTDVRLCSNDSYVYVLGIRIINPFNFFELNGLEKPSHGNILISIRPAVYDMNLINKFAKKYNLKPINNTIPT